VPELKEKSLPIGTGYCYYSLMKFIHEGRRSMHGEPFFLAVIEIICKFEPVWRLFLVSNESKSIRVVYYAHRLDDSIVANINTV